jgi:hypothetical protein
MPPLVLFTSLFFFSVAFALSLLSEKLLGLVLGSIFLSSILQVAWTYVAFRAEARGLLSHGELYPWLDAYKLALVLSCLAFLAASLLTFRRVDFSQPKRKAASLAKYASLFLTVAWLLSILWPTLRPGRPEELESRIEVVGANAYFATTRGFYRYDIGRDSLKKIIRWNRRYYFSIAIKGGKVLYSGLDTQGQLNLFILNLDGEEQKMLLGPGTGDGRLDLNLWPLSLALSPDGRRAAVIAMKRDEDGHSRPDAVWIIPTDGSGRNEPLKFDTTLQAQPKTPLWFRIATSPPAYGDTI